MSKMEHLKAGRPKNKNLNLPIFSFFVLALFVFSVALSGCLSGPGNIAECESKERIWQRDECYYSNAIAQSRLGYCTQIISDVNRNKCINAVSG